MTQLRAEERGERWHLTAKCVWWMNWSWKARTTVKVTVIASRKSEYEVEKCVLLVVKDTSTSKVWMLHLPSWILGAAANGEAAKGLVTLTMLVWQEQHWCQNWKRHRKVKVTVDDECDLWDWNWNAETRMHFQLQNSQISQWKLRGAKTNANFFTVTIF